MPKMKLVRIHWRNTTSNDTGTGDKMDRITAGKQLRLLERANITDMVYWIEEVEDKSDDEK